MESLYTTLSPDSKPKLETVFKLMRALGVKLTAIPETAHAYVEEWLAARRPSDC
jgi:DNA-binding phage protein